MSSLQIALLIGGIVVGVIVILLIYLLIYFLVIKKKKMTKYASFLQDRYLDLINTLKNDCENRLTRIKEMADHNAPYFKENYDKVLTEFNNLYNVQSLQVKETIDALQIQPDTHNKTNLLKQNIKEAEKELDAFEININKLKNFITEIRKEDESHHAMVWDSKTRLRKFKEQLNNHETELRPIATSLDNLDKAFEDSFQVYESYLDKADYSSAITLLNKINKVLDNLEMYGYQLHIDIPLIYNIIPQKLDELKEEEKLALNDNVPLNSLNLTYIYDQIENRLSEMKIELSNLQLSNIKVSIKEITDLINETSDKIKLEIQSKEIFDSLINASNQELSSITKDYKDMSNKLVDIQANFVLDPSILKSLNTIANKTMLVNTLQKELNDTLIDNDDYMYSSLLNTQTKINELKDDIKDNLIAIDSSLQSIKNQVNEISTGLLEAYIVLCNARKAIYEIDVKNYTKDKIAEFTSLVGEIDKINKFLSYSPIDTIELIEIYNQFVTRKNKFIGQIRRDIVMVNKTEMLLAYANQLRLTNNAMAIVSNASQEKLNEGKFEEAYLILNNEFEKYGLNQGGKITIN